MKPEGGHRSSEWTSQSRSTTDKQNLKKEMREGWDREARGNWRRSIWAEASDTEESFRASGDRDYKRYVGRFLSTLQIDPAEMVALEIGCGVGRVSEFLARDFFRLVALDISRQMLKIGRQRVTANNILWLCNDGISLGPVADHSVDFIFSFGVFQQIPDEAAIAGYVAEAGRTLKAGGWFVFQVMNQPHLSVGPWTASLFVSSSYHVPRVRIYKRAVLDACPIRMRIILKSCKNSGLEVVLVLHRFTQNTWIWAQKKG
ncbi:MAG: class I SAM-dependent methyltransferase [Terriglobia bacterium]